MTAEAHTTVPTPAEVRRRVLTTLYGPEVDELERAVDELIAGISPPRRATPWDERTAWLIAYPYQVHTSGEAPLRTMRRAFVEHLRPELTGVHVLPFHPSSSDGGFSVTDFELIDPAFGSWDDLADLAATTDVMADAVVNHASAQGVWFRGFLAGDPDRHGFFRTVEPDADLADVVRPRESPVVVEFERSDAPPVSVWATFSHDQIDLDYRNPHVLLAMTEVILSYVAAGAHAIRLDAVAFVWKQEGTASIHLPGTHEIIQFFRACLDEIDPEIVIVTETNVPHRENISYFGVPPAREAQAVYQFPLPPLVLHSFVSGSAVALSDWARSLTFDRDDTTFLNFLASHDGIGLRPIEGLLDDDELARLIETCRAGGGVVNSRRLPDGTNAAYELCGTWYSLLAIGHGDDEALDRHLASHAIALALRGVPLLYVHSLAASASDHERFAATGQGRDLNRATFDLDQVDTALADPDSRAHRSWNGLRGMLRRRASSPAFDPHAAQHVLDTPTHVFAVRRTATSGEQALVAVNVSGEAAVFDVSDDGWHDFDGRRVSRHLEMAPWTSRWLRRAP